MISPLEDKRSYPTVPNLACAFVALEVGSFKCHKEWSTAKNVIDSNPRLSIVHPPRKYMKLVLEILKFNLIFFMFIRFPTILLVKKMCS